MQLRDDIRRTVGMLRRTALAAFATAAVAGACLGPAAAQAPAPAREARAIDALTAMGKYLRTLKTFSVSAETAIDEVLDNGQKVQFGGIVEYRVQSPDRMRVEVRTDRRTRQFVFDGKTITQYAPRAGYYASVPARGTIREALVLVDRKYDVEIPLADLFFWGTDQAGLDDIKEAAYLGPAKIGGRSCDHYAFRQEGVDWQVWIQPGKQPLPCKMVITTTSEPSQPQYTSVLKWDLAPKFDAATFRFTPPKGAHRIEAAPLAAAK